jgi:DNA (cytosine-5)-methyltransferase 1
MTKRLLDLFCGAGGAAMGYHRAGFDVVGVDIKPQKHYPFEFHQEDALQFAMEHGREFDVIHASPPCQCYSVTASLSNGKHPDLVLIVRGILDRIGRPYVIENVPGSPLYNPLMICGTMFGLRVIRHRLFECNPPIYFAPKTCHHDGRVLPMRWKTRQEKLAAGKTFEYITVSGNSFLIDEARAAMGIEWMNRKEIAQAIPPAYTEWIGNQLVV